MQVLLCRSLPVPDSSGCCYWPWSHLCSRISPVLNAVCTNSPEAQIDGTFASCDNPTSRGDTCEGSCMAGYVGSLSATCTGPNTWDIDSKCQPGKSCWLGCSDTHWQALRPSLWSQSVTLARLAELLQCDTVGIGVHRVPCSIDSCMGQSLPG